MYVGVDVWGCQRVFFFFSKHKIFYPIFIKHHKNFICLMSGYIDWTEGISILHHLSWLQLQLDCSFNRTDSLLVYSKFSYMAFDCVCMNITMSEIVSAYFPGFQSCAFVCTCTCLQMYAQECVSGVLIKTQWRLPLYDCHTDHHILPGNQGGEYTQLYLLDCQQTIKKAIKTATAVNLVLSCS